MPRLALVQPEPLELTAEAPRPDHFVIAQLIESGARVLDVGCGNGALLRRLANEKQARGSGLERDPAKVRTCVGRGLSVAQGEADRDLAAFPSSRFDAVIFSHTLQQLADPPTALRHAARIGARVIVAMENAGHWSARRRLLMHGRIARWNEPLHACSVRDMAELAQQCGLNIETAVPLSRGHAGAPFAKTLWRANWFAEQAVFLLTP